MGWLFLEKKPPDDFAAGYSNSDFAIAQSGLRYPAGAGSPGVPETDACDGLERFN